MTAALTSEASIWAMLLMLGFVGLGFAMFSVGMKIEKIFFLGVFIAFLVFGLLVVYADWCGGDICG